MSADILAHWFKAFYYDFINNYIVWVASVHYKRWWFERCWHDFNRHSKRFCLSLEPTFTDINTKTPPPLDIESLYSTKSVVVEAVGVEVLDGTAISSGLTSSLDTANVCLCCPICPPI
ncbi:hypothetical protein GUJ93_ZPchr0013g34253 [Zizania palustris]|uniref:Uncharacterized protein n=1 Tax=Zizania palustris TaxID=103762 RepID=A0A8J6C0A2_ZIZPA|nr:hypothetical protein GUJ93_ZPchr0013g34253 [Zizania palustris]